MKIAVLNCKAAKQKYPCKVEEMYQPSRMFRNQINFFRVHYDGWILISTKYGCLNPIDIIEPYNITFDHSGQTLRSKGYGFGKNYKEAERPSKEYRKEWADKVRNWSGWNFEINSYDFYIGSHYQRGLQSWLNKHGRNFTIPGKSFGFKTGTAIVASEYKNFLELGLTPTELLEQGWLKLRK